MTKINSKIYVLVVVTIVLAIVCIYKYKNSDNINYSQKKSNKEDACVVILRMEQVNNEKIYFLNGTKIGAGFDAQEKIIHLLKKYPKLPFLVHNIAYGKDNSMCFREKLYECYIEKRYWDHYVKNIEKFTNKNTYHFHWHTWNGREINFYWGSKYVGKDLIGFYQIIDYLSKKSYKYILVDGSSPGFNKPGSYYDSSFLDDYAYKWQHSNNEPYVQLEFPLKPHPVALFYDIIEQKGIVIDGISTKNEMMKQREQEHDRLLRFLSDDFGGDNFVDDDFVDDDFEGNDFGDDKGLLK